VPAPKDKPQGALTPYHVGIVALLVGGLMLAHLAGFSQMAWAAALFVVVIEGAAAAAVVTAAGGFGWLVLGRIAPQDSALGLRVISACALGLWMFSTAVLVVGSAFSGALRWWIWWPVVGVGILLAAWQGRGRMETLRAPKHVDGRALIWVAVAVAVGIWLAGAGRPPGFIATSDRYDVLEYHLQVPREFHDAQRVGELRHNCYSYYPLGTEMLFLLAMTLRGGAYEGMYLAKLLHGAFGVLTVGAVFGALRRDDEHRARFSMGLLATAPFLVYLCWLAMVELAQVCYLALAVLWLRQWLRRQDLRPAVCVGVMLGAACATKYLAVGFVAAPVLAMMLLACLRRPKRLRHVAAAAAVALLPFAPWLVRNTVYTGNPVFPLATGLFGKAHWSDESARRWTDGHAPDKRPPVPQPPGWQKGEQRSRLGRFFDNFALSQWYSPMVVILALVALCALAARRGPPPWWDWSLAGVLAIQLAVWVLWTHEMPGRFLVPALVPLALLVGGMLSGLARVRENPFTHQLSPRGPWGLPVAVAVFAGAAGVNLMTCYGMYSQMVPADQRAAIPAGIPGELIQRELYLRYNDLPDDCRPLLVGDARAFYWPEGTVYATPFDAQPLLEVHRQSSGPEDMLRRLREKGVTHVVVNWSEIRRLAGTYGFPAGLSHELYERRLEGSAPGLAIIEQLKPHGLALVKEIYPYQPDSATSPATMPATAPAEIRWPVVSIYSVPPVKTAAAAATATSPGPNRP